MRSLRLSLRQSAAAGGGSAALGSSFSCTSVSGGLLRSGAATHSASSPSVSCGSLVLQRRFVGPRQYAPKGFREASGRLPMNDDFADECNQLAKVAHQTKNYGDAISLYDRVLSYRRERDGPITERCAAVLHNIGRVFLDMKEYGAAENAFTEAAAIYEQIDGEPKSIRYAESLALLGLTYVYLKFTPEAEKAFREAIIVFRDRCYNHPANSWLPDNYKRDGPPKEPQKTPLASAAHALADCAQLSLMRNDEYQAIALMEEALQIRRYLYSNHNKYRPMIAQTLNKLCELKKTINDGTGAEMNINECLEICIATLGRDSPATAQATSSKAALVAARKQYREALKLYEESSTTYALVLGKDSALFGLELVKLGRVQEMLEDLSLAEKTYRRGLEIIQKTFGPASPQVAEASTFLASLLGKTNQTDEAIGLLRDAIRIRKAINKQDPQLAYLYQKLGDIYAARRESHAEAYFLLAIEHFRENSKIDSNQRTYITDVLDDLGLFYVDFNHFDKAENCLKEALDLRIEMLGEDHAVVAYSYSNFSLLYLQKAEYENCEKFAMAAVEKYAKIPNVNVLAQADVYTTLGQCCHAQKNYPDALKWHEKALNIRRLRGDNSLIATGESLNHLARVYVAMKRYAQATKLIAEAKRIAFTYDVNVTETLRNEIGVTEKNIPPIEDWDPAERAEATPAIEIPSKKPAA